MWKSSEAFKQFLRFFETYLKLESLAKSFSWLKEAELIGRNSNRFVDFSETYKKFFLWKVQFKLSEQWKFEIYKLLLKKFPETYPN